MKGVASALYEVGEVRLPSILGLEIINEAQTAIQRAERTSMLQLDAKESEGQLERLRDAWSRVDKGWKTGYPHQIDNPYVDASSNGLTYLVDKFKGQKIAAHVTLEKGERSELAEIATNLLV